MHVARECFWRTPKDATTPSAERQLFAPIAQFLKTNLAIGQSVTDKLQLIDNQISKKGQSVTDKFVMPMLQVSCLLSQKHYAHRRQ